MVDYFFGGNQIVDKLTKILSMEKRESLNHEVK
jgi:hypothetical protein